MKSKQNYLETQVREIYGRVIYAHKTHEKCAELLEERSACLKWLEIILSASTTTSILGVIFGDGLFFQFIAALFSTALLGLTLYSKDFNVSQLAERHKHAALSILEIREELLSLLIDVRIGNRNLDGLQDRRDKLLSKLVQCYKGAPNTNWKAYSLASKALKENEEFTFSDEEIDKFLPEALRSAKN